ncbi:NADH-quinone oxidoreductase subunit C [Streptomyces kanamyceticus]|uniref:NADH-quinone oxidoreductase subunit C n=1 Tax=Streptomyces kanamyceticus TaxID=1967 RepID=A0A5J6G9L8_STRKN|nr:NADH-quinone oxidoreductase subunit C [Streptomyces kanamyceticus]QEU92490.1 NADH-quinone oxidoreductase subunit C [Streptomyces kanamyceticus]
MTGWLPSPVEELFGPEATAEESYDVLTVDVPAASWTTALETARTTLTCTYFDWLSAVDEPGTGFLVSAHVVALAPVRRLLVRTTVPHDAPVLASAVDVYAGAAWHERETHEMFGVTFEGHPGLVPLLLPENFEGHPLRKDFVLAARVAKAWPGAKEPGESEHGGPKRRQMLPPGVPDPNEWGPLKGQLPPAPARPARGAGRAAAGGAAGGERPARRTRTAGEGSASQAADAAGAAEAGAGASAGPGAPAASTETTAPARPARRSRSVSQGSASQRAAAAPEPTPAPEGAAEPEEAQSPAASGSDAPSGSDDAPWHHARPAFDDAKRTRPEPEPEQPEPGPKPEPEQPEPGPKPEPEQPEPGPEPKPEQPTQPPENGERPGGTE